MTMLSGLVFNIQRFSVHDGPGIRTTVFLKGCPLACSWCHNPEGITGVPEVLVSPQRCIGCGQCVEVCPQGLPVPGRAPTPDDAALCSLCGACAEICPCEARQIAGRWMTVDQVVSELLKDRVFFEESGGGVTFSGGEPLAQATFLRAALAACGSRGLHTAVDTSGLAPLEDLLEVAALADLVLFDLKLIDEHQHRRHTGVSNARILANLRSLGEAHPRIWVRVPVIPGVNDDRENLRATAALAVSIPAVERICLLPFHPLGEDKSRRLGRQAAGAGIPRPSRARMQELVKLVEDAGITASIGG